MSDMTQIKKYRKPRPQAPKVAETSTAYALPKKTVAVADFTFRKFKKIAALMPFTQSEWANFLHLSERTLQRYSKSNHSFEGIYTDRILLIQELIHTGLDTFQNAATLYEWLKKEKNVMGIPLGFESMQSSRGIQQLIDQLLRIQYGVYA